MTVLSLDIEYEDGVDHDSRLHLLIQARLGYRNKGKKQFDTYIYQIQRLFLVLGQFILSLIQPKFLHQFYLLSSYSVVKLFWVCYLYPHFFAGFFLF